MSVLKLLLILLLILIIFGAGKLPKVMGDFGKGLKAFRRGMSPEDEPHKKEEITEQKKDGLQ